MPTPNRFARYALCLRNDDCEDLELRKLYRVMSDKRAERDGYLRVVDESGEDYLYPATYFYAIALPPQAQAAMTTSSQRRRPAQRRRRTTAVNA